MNESEQNYRHSRRRAPILLPETWRWIMRRSGDPLELTSTRTDFSFCALTSFFTTISASSESTSLASCFASCARRSVSGTRVFSVAGLICSSSVFLSGVLGVAGEGLLCRVGRSSLSWVLLCLWRMRRRGVLLYRALISCLRWRFSFSSFARRRSFSRRLSLLGSKYAVVILAMVQRFEDWWTYAFLQRTMSLFRRVFR